MMRHHWVRESDWSAAWDVADEQVSYWIATGISAETALAAVEAITEEELWDVVRRRLAAAWIVSTSKDERGH